jgi:hypothetical protein
MKIRCNSDSCCEQMKSGMCRVFVERDEYEDESVPCE